MSDYDEDSFEGIYQEGHWEWNNVLESLYFKSDLPELAEDITPPTPTLIGSFEFKEDLDLMEQQRFRKRFQRKFMDNDVIHLQDIKDVVLYTAPKAILSPALVNILHLPMTERFIRALLLYSQYFIQISDEMSKRILELHVKIRTPKSEEIELEFRENLEDLRLLVAKEYSCIIIELEIHRLFKSEIYNIIEHKINTKYESELSERELFVLFGHCVRRNRMINTHSPLHNEMQCGRHIDYRLMGLGLIQYPKLSQRLQYLERLLTMPEVKFKQLKLSLGILGLSRVRFDTMLREIKMAASTTSSASSSRQSIGKFTSASRASRVSTSMKKSATSQKLYEEITIPPKYEEEECIPDVFPMEMFPKKRCNDQQKQKWMSYASLIMNKRKKN